LNKIIHETSGADAEITSIREGDVVGTHTVLLDSEFDTMMLVHDAKSRRGFASGAVRAAEWIKGKKGFYEFRDVFSEMK
jgi:4-hydroxy-tetrahydrodipicolinate reductase